ncbi:uncharacterized protein LOC130766695 isoform X2 [Actinidia eriantha]|uniref:uncharacterized protein LOC130766695 isoform X2 n=1 Tax=Actinidia eriantha TaxID=165200 RepID=UPI00258B5F16|nr:uncharacterized protein LOC130766695 isoform X2 [Actinidia eriantha]
MWNVVNELFHLIFSLRIDQVMDSDNLNNGEDPPLSTSTVQENDTLALANGQNGAGNNPVIFHNRNSNRVDPLSFPAPSVPWMHMHRADQPYTLNIPQNGGNMMVDLNQLHNLQNSLIDPNSININTSIPNLYRRGSPFPDGNVNQVSYAHDNAGGDDTSMNYPPHFNSFQNSEINRNFMGIRGYAGGGYQMTRQGGEAGSYIHEPQLKDFVGLGGTEMYYPQSNGHTNIDNRGTAAQFGYPNKIDGNFLSLGIGGKMDTISRSDLSSRDISNKLDFAVSPQLNTSHVRQATGSLSPGQNMFSGLSSFQNNIGGFTTPIHNAGGWATANNNVELIRGTNTGLKSSPFHILQKPQADMSHGFPESSNRNLGFIGNRDLRHLSIDPYKSLGELSASSGPFSSSPASFLGSGQNEASGLASESVKFNRTTTRQTSDQLQKRLMETMQFSPESSMVSSFTRFKGNRQENSGQLFHASKDSMAQVVDQSAQIPRRKHVQTAGKLLSSDEGTAPCVYKGGLFPKRIGVQINEDSAAQASGSGLLHQRLGVHVNEHSATQVAGYGLSKEGLPLQFSQDLLGPTSTTVSTAKVYGTSQDSNVLGGPSLQRGVIRGPPPAPEGQRRKRAHKPPIIPSVPSPLRTAPAGAISTPALVPHIKWQDPDGIPRLTGQKCMICKRDLSFTAEGRVFLPTRPPAVAILPCGHTFHDHCLHCITPQDLSKNPPCIPCAIGDI